MIEKLDLEKRKSFGLLDWFAHNGEPSGAGLVGSKINELVDAVNSLRDDCNLLMGYIAPEAKCEAEPADPYAEQRKWIGKLCRFWDSDKDIARIGILSDIQRGMYFIKQTSMAYGNCEPVKPDDDIIYKEEQNDLL